MSKLYLAYGSNLNLAQMERRCPTASIVGSADIEGYQMLFRGSKNSAVATIEPTSNAADKIPVLVWELEEYDEQALDRYEGWPSFYRKETMEVMMESGETINAMVYVMNDGFEIGMPSESYLNCILDGYEDSDFDPTAIEKAMEISQEHMKNQSMSDFDKMDMDWKM